MLESFEHFRKRFMGHYYTPPKEIIEYERNMTQKETIQKLLKEKAISQKSIAKALNVSCTIVNNVIAGRDRSAKVEKAITQLTGYQFPQTFKSDEEVKNMLQGVI